MKNLCKLLKKIVFVVILFYAIITFCNQQKILNTYATQSEEITEQIKKANEYNKQLNEEKENVTSKEYIESQAREKLDMYLPNERIYVNNKN